MKNSILILPNQKIGFIINSNLGINFFPLFIPKCKKMKEVYFNG